jgi:hypothetical protein
MLNPSIDWYRLYQEESATNGELRLKIKQLETELLDWKEQRAPRAMIAGQIIRQDWSGNQFDGRSVKTWIKQALTGDYANFDMNLKWFEEEYGCTLEDAKKAIS